MKTSTMGVVTQINKEELKNLLTVTKETLATDVLSNKNNTATFASVNLWRVQKGFRTSVSMRRYL